MIDRKKLEELRSGLGRLHPDTYPEIYPELLDTIDALLKVKEAAEIVSERNNCLDVRGLSELRIVLDDCSQSGVESQDDEGKTE